MEVGIIFQKFSLGGGMESDQNVFSFMIDGKELLADVDMGEVLEIQSHSETRISGSGGEGSISTSRNTGVSGSISPINISSTVINRTKIWVKTSDFAEDEWIFPFDLTTLSVRKGHKIGRYIVFDAEKRQGWVRKFINFTTNRSIDVESSERTLKSLGLLREVEGFGSYIAIGAGVGLFIGFILGNVVSAGLGFFVFICGLVGGMLKAKDTKVNNENFNKSCCKQLEEADGKVMELIASNNIPTAVAYFKAKKEQKS